MDADDEGTPRLSALMFKRLRFERSRSLMQKELFTMVDPNLVPKIRLGDGTLVPAVGIGTFASDNYTSDVVSAAV